MKKNKRSIPIFKDVDEEATFWDTHDITDFESEMEDIEMIFAVDKPQEETLVIRLRKDLKDHLKMQARLKGLSVSTLARMWLTEKVLSPLTPSRYK